MKEFTSNKLFLIKRLSILTVLSALFLSCAHTNTDKNCDIINDKNQKGENLAHNCLDHEDTGWTPLIDRL